MKCPDCKGSGKYVGAGTQATEDCLRCKGLGEIGPGASHAAEKRSRDKALDSLFEANKLPDWMEDHKDEIDLDEIRNPCKEIPLGFDGSDMSSGEPGLLPKLKIGDHIHVFDAGWTVAEVTNIGPNGIVALAPCDRFYWKSIGELSYNVTRGQWEYIRAGTPVWP